MRPRGALSEGVAKVLRELGEGEAREVSWLVSCNKIIGFILIDISDPDCENL